MEKNLSFSKQAITSTKLIENFNKANQSGKIEKISYLKVLVLIQANQAITLKNFKLFLEQNDFFGEV